MCRYGLSHLLHLEFFVGFDDREVGLQLRANHRTPAVDLQPFVPPVAATLAPSDTIDGRFGYLHDTEHDCQVEQEVFDLEPGPRGRSRQFRWKLDALSKKGVGLRSFDE